MAASTSSPAALSSSLVANIASSRSSVHGSSLSFSVLAPPSPKPSTLSCRAEKSIPDCLPSPPTSRRLALALLAGVVAVGARVSPAEAAYGEAANIFGSIKKDTGFIPFSGNGFKLDIPSKWNPSKEAEFPGTVVRYEDNFDTNSNVAVMVTPTSKASIKDYGTPENFLESVSFLLGKQAYAGKTQSEGGFDADAVATAAILESSTPVIDGKDYYNISVLTRTADGNEGGKHQLIVATVNDGKLYLCKAQAGDKRWFKGAKKFVEGTVSSFSLA